MATDAEGFLYLVGSSTSVDIPLKEGVKDQLHESQLLASTDAGASWTQAGNLPMGPPRSLAAHPSVPGVVFAGGTHGLFKSTDAGKTWKLVYQSPAAQWGGSEPGVWDIAVDPGNPTRVFALAWQDGLLISTNTGETWQRAETPGGQYLSPRDRIFVDPKGSGTVLAMLLTGFWISRDGGRTWNPAMAWRGVPWAAAFDPHRAGWIWAATAVGVFAEFLLSKDDGRTWSTRSSPPFLMYDLVADPSRPDRLYAVSSSVYRSDDGGASWQRLTDSGPVSVDRLVQGCGAGGPLIAYSASSWSSGLVRSLDQGETWTVADLNRVRAIGFGAGCSGFAARDIAGDAWVAKYAPDGRDLQWAVFLGGGDADAARKLAVDAQGNVIVAGETRSADFPGEISGARGQGDLFVVKLDRDGQVVSSKILGGTNYEGLTGLAGDAQGGVYLTGSTLSQNFPVTPGAFQTEFPGPYEASFVARLDADGSLRYATYLDASIQSIAVDPQGEAVLVGTRRTSGFLARMDANGSTLTYQSPPIPGTPRLVRLTPEGDLLVAGDTVADDFPVTPGAYSSRRRSTQCLSGGRYPRPGGDLFVMKLRAQDQRPAFSTLIGGECPSTPGSLELDADGNVTLAVQTWASGFPLRQPVLASGGNAVIVKLSGDGASLLYGTYLDAAAMPVTASGPDNSVYAGVSRNGDVLLLKLETAAEGPAELNRVANAFSGISAGVVPGALMTLSGRNLGPEDGVDLGLNSKQRLPLELAGTRVLFDGVPAPILATSPARVICVAPHSLSSWTGIQVEFHGQRSNEVLLPVLSVKPGLLAQGFPDVSERPWDGTDGVIFNEDGTENGPADPAFPGSTVSLFATGLALPQSPPEAGTIASTDTMKPRVPVYGSWTTGLEGQSEGVGTVPGFVSAMYQIRMKAPRASGTEPVSRVSVFLTDRATTKLLMEERSNVVWLYVR